MCALLDVLRGRVITLRCRLPLPLPRRPLLQPLAINETAFDAGLTTASASCTNPNQDPAYVLPLTLEVWRDNSSSKAANCTTGLSADNYTITASCTNMLSGEDYSVRCWATETYASQPLPAADAYAFNS